MKIISSSSLLIVFVAALALQTFTAQAARVIGSWYRNFEGIEYAEGSDTSPRLQNVFALRISLKNPDVQAFTTPGNGGAPGETSLQTHLNFMNAYGLKCAVNASYFTVPQAGYANIEGVLLCNGSFSST